MPLPPSEPEPEPPAAEVHAAAVLRGQLRRLARALSVVAGTGLLPVLAKPVRPARLRAFLRSAEPG